MIKSLSLVAIVFLAQHSLADVQIPEYPAALVSVCQFAQLNMQASVALSKKVQLVDGYEYGSLIVTGELQSPNGQVIKAMRDCNVLNGAYHCAFQVNSSTRLELTAPLDKGTFTFKKASIVSWKGDSPKAYSTQDCASAVVEPVTGELQN